MPRVCLWGDVVRRFRWRTQDPVLIANTSSHFRFIISEPTPSVTFCRASGNNVHADVRLLVMSGIK
jgi:hypothetical protein